MNINKLELWKHKEMLTIDEFIYLIFGHVPPRRFRLSLHVQNDLPEEAHTILDLLVDDLNRRKFDVYYDSDEFDPRVNGSLTHFATIDYLAWGNGLLDKEQLKEWLVEKNIPSDFFGISSEENKFVTNASGSSVAYELNKIINIDPNKITSQLVYNNYLLIGVLLEFIVGSLRDENPKNQAELVDIIVARYFDDGISSLSERNVKGKFATGNKVKKYISKMLEIAKDKHDQEINDY